MLQTLYCSQTSSFIRTPLRLRRWTACSTVLHRYLYSPIEKEIYQQEHSTITQWFASPPNRKLLSLIPSTNSNCLSLPPDVYPILQIDQTTFQIEPSTAIIIPASTFCSDFEDYIQLLPPWISNLISNFRTNPLADSLVQYIQQKNPYTFPQTVLEPIKRVGAVGSYLSSTAQ